MDWKIPLSDIDFGPEEISAVQSVLESRWLTMGAVTQKFEEEFAHYTGAKHAIAVTNATAALHMACAALGLKPGDEVVVPSLTFVATANAIRYVGARPVFADIESRQDFTISCSSIEKCLTDRTRAIIVMHYGGHACDMHAILKLAKEHDLAVIEDAAHAIGSEVDGRKLGTWGDVGCFSFFSNKNMTTGEGGMLVTDNDKLAMDLSLMRSHGMTSLTWDRHKGHSWSYDVVMLGYNYRIDELRSALGRVQLEKLDRNNAARQHLTDLYCELIPEFAPAISVPFELQRGSSACHLFPVLLPTGMDRTRFMEQMKAQGIQTSIHYPPIHKFKAYVDAGLSSDTLPITEDVAMREVTLPLYASLGERNVRDVAEALGIALKQQKTN